MKRYINHIINTRAPHERRQHAMQIAGAVTALVFAVWIGTLGMRLGGGTVAADDTGTQTVNPDVSLTASAAAARQDNAAHLEVSTTSVYSN